MVPSEYLWMYLWANAFALATLAVAFRWPTVGRWIGAGLFVWASVTNATFAIQQPAVYLDYASLTSSALYRDFILGWFSEHARGVVLPIAAGQATIACLLAAPALKHRRLGAVGAVIFLLAIAPLGVGSAFPFSLTFAAALLVSVGWGDVRAPWFRGVLRWTPRVLGATIAAGLLLLSLDAFDTTSSMFANLAQFSLHLVPAGLAVAVLAVAWRHAWIGGVGCFALAGLYAAMVRGRIDWMAVVAVPLLVEGAMFLWSSAAPRERRWSSVTKARRT